MQGCAACRGHGVVTVPVSRERISSASSATVFQRRNALHSVSSCRSPTGITHSQLSGRTRNSVIAHQKGNLADDLLDYVTAGPKMRKWYGQAERGAVVQGEREDEQQQQQPQDSEEDDKGMVVMVTDADTPTGEQVILQLILARAEVRILVRDTVAAQTSYGPYVTPVSIDTSNPALLKRVLKGCKSVVCLGRPGALPQAAKEAGVEHIVLLSAVGGAQGGFLSSLFNRELSELCDPAREAAVAGPGHRHTIVRVSGVRDAPGGRASLALQPLQSGKASASEAVSREDLACVLVHALLNPPQASRAFQVVSTTPGTPADLGSLFNALD